jgi:hypothetical protein
VPKYKLKSVKAAPKQPKGNLSPIWNTVQI